MKDFDGYRSEQASLWTRRQQGILMSTPQLATKHPLCLICSNWALCLLKYRKVSINHEDSISSHIVAYWAWIQKTKHGDCVYCSTVVLQYCKAWWIAENKTLWCHVTDYDTLHWKQSLQKLIYCRKEKSHFKSSNILVRTAVYRHTHTVCTNGRHMHNACASLMKDFKLWFF